MNRALANWNAGAIAASGGQFTLTSRIGQGTKIIVTVLIVKLNSQNTMSQAPPIRILIAEDHAVAAGLAAIIEDEADMQVVAQARTDNRQWNSTGNTSWMSC